MSSKFLQHRPTFRQLIRNSIYLYFRCVRRASDCRPDGSCTLDFRSKSPTVLGQLKLESCGKTSSVVQGEVSIKAAGRWIRAAGRPGVVCIGRLLAILREVGVINRGIGLEVSFSDLVIMGFPGWQRRDNDGCHRSGYRLPYFQRWKQFEET